jgi:hypothetical protein
MQPRGQTDTSNSPGNWMDVFTPGRLALVIGLLLFVLYPAVLLGTETFFYQDFGLFTYPVAHYAQESFHHGEVPLWNPLNNCGVPFLAQWNTSVCYPLSLIYLLLPLPWSLNFFGFVHLVLAGVGMYFLAYHWTHNRLAASLAGLAFAMNGLMLNCLLWTSNLAALSWQPLVVLATWQAWQRGGGRRIAWAALAGAMQMLSGAPEIIIFTWALLAVLWLGEWRCQGLLFWPSFRRLAGIALLVAGLAAVQIFPFLDLLRHSERGTAFVEADQWSLPRSGLANFIVPQFHSSQALLDTYHLPDQYWTKSYYLGLAVLVLAGIGVWRGRRLQTWWLFGATVLGLILALGNDGFVYAWLKHVVPAIGFARYPIKFIALPIFAIPLLAAYGFNALQPGIGDIFRRERRAVGWWSGLLLLAALAILAAARWLPRAGIDESWSATWHSALLRMIFLGAFFGVVMAWLPARTPRLSCLLGVAILALVGLDLATSAMRLHPTVTARVYGPLEFNMSRLPRLGESRAWVSLQSESMLDQIGTTNPVTYCIGIRGALFENNNLLDAIPKVDGFCSLKLKDTADVISILGGTHALAEPLADFLGVAQMNTPDNLFAWQTRTNFLPPITAGQRPSFAGETETLKAIGANDFDPRRSVYLPPNVAAEVTATNFCRAEILATQWSAQRIQFSVQAAAPAMVVVAQSFYHDWQACVDGQPVKIWRANQAFQALEVPAGQHEVLLIYQDRPFQVGAVVSGLTLAAGCILLRRRIPTSSA